jgi:hypothetical protein
MKSGPKADYPVKVFRELLEQEPPTEQLYEGIFTAVLNYVVRIAFVPDVRAVAPPWDDHLLPANFDDITSPEQARLATALFSPYVVTPNEDRAGEDERFEWGHDNEYGPSSGVVFYVTSGAFDRHTVDLAALAELSADSFYPEETVSMLRGYEVIGFLERRVLASRWLQPQHAAMLCLTPVDGRQAS